MKKILVSLVFLFGSYSVFSDIIYLSDVKVNEVSVYDDWEGGVILVGASSYHSACPKGQYINPKALTFDKLYSAVLVAATSNVDVRFQLYSDSERKIGDRCEIDAIRLYF